MLLKLGQSGVLRACDVDIVVEGELATGGLLLGDMALRQLIEALDLVQLRGPGVLLRSGRVVEDFSFLFSFGSLFRALD